MAGDEDRPGSEGPGAIPPGEQPAEVAASEPAVAAGAADLATPERPAESYGASPAMAPRRSVASTLLSLIGVVIIALLAWGIYTLYHPPGDDKVTALNADVAALRQRIDSLPKPDDAKVDALRQEVDRLKAVTSRNAQAAKSADDAKAEAGKAVDEAKAGLAPLQGKVADLERSIAPLDGRIADNAKTVAAVQAAVAAVPKVDLAPLRDQLAAIDKRLVPLEAYFNAPKSTERTEARQNGSAAETRTGPIAIIAQGILAAIPAGRPFEVEAKALKALGIDEADLKPIDAIAAKGAATQPDLVSGFDKVRDSLVVAAAPVSSGTMLDRMMANAESLVKVSRTGAAPGDSTDAITARIDADLKRGAFPEALAEWNKLPDASKQRSADWAATLDARVAAEAAARAIETKAVGALAAQQP